GLVEVVHQPGQLQVVGGLQYQFALDTIDGGLATVDVEGAIARRWRNRQLLLRQNGEISLNVDQPLDVLVIGAEHGEVVTTHHVPEHPVGLDAHFVVGNQLRLVALEGREHSAIEVRGVEAALAVTAAGHAVEEDAVIQLIVETESPGGLLTIGIGTGAGRAIAGADIAAAHSNGFGEGAHFRLVPGVAQAEVELEALHQIAEIVADLAEQRLVLTVAESGVPRGGHAHAELGAGRPLWLRLQVEGADDPVELTVHGVAEELQFVGQLAAVVLGVGVEHRQRGAIGILQHEGLGFAVAEDVAHGDRVVHIPLGLVGDAPEAAIDDGLLTIDDLVHAAILLGSDQLINA